MPEIKESFEDEVVSDVADMPSEGSEPSPDVEQANSAELEEPAASEAEDGTETGVDTDLEDIPDEEIIHEDNDPTRYDNISEDEIRQLEENTDLNEFDCEDPEYLENGTHPNDEPLETEEDEETGEDEKVGNTKNETDGVDETEKTTEGTEGTETDEDETGKTENVETDGTETDGTETDEDENGVEGNKEGVDSTKEGVGAANEGDGTKTDEVVDEEKRRTEPLVDVDTDPETEGIGEGTETELETVDEDPIRTEPLDMKEVDKEPPEKEQWSPEKVQDLLDDPEKIVNMASHNDESDTLVLGKYEVDADKKMTPDCYSEYARSRDASYYELPGELWDKLHESHPDMFDFNRAYLDNQIEKGKDIVFSHNPWDSKNQMGDFMREVNYLSYNGYRVSQFPNADGKYFAVKVPGGN